MDVKPRSGPRERLCVRSSAWAQCVELADSFGLGRPITACCILDQHHSSVVSPPGSQTMSAKIGQPGERSHRPGSHWRSHWDRPPLVLEARSGQQGLPARWGHSSCSQPQPAAPATAAMRGDVAPSIAATRARPWGRCPPPPLLPLPPEPTRHRCVLLPPRVVQPRPSLARPLWTATSRPCPCPTTRARQGGWDGRNTERTALVRPGFRPSAPPCVRSVHAV